MGVTRKVIKEGTSSEMPKKGDEVTVEYTGYLYDSNVGPEKDFRGKQYVHYTLHQLVTILEEISLINAALHLDSTHL